MKIIKILFTVILFLFGCMEYQSKEEVYYKDTLEIKELHPEDFENDTIIVLNDTQVVISQSQISKESTTRQKNQISELDTTSFLKDLSRNLDIIEQQQNELDSLLKSHQN